MVYVAKQMVEPGLCYHRCIQRYCNGSHVSETANYVECVHVVRGHGCAGIHGAAIGGGARQFDAAVETGLTSIELTDGRLGIRSEARASYVM